MSPLRGQLLLYETTALLGALLGVEATALLLEFRTSVILDWFIALAPLMWLNVSIIILYVFLRELFQARTAAASRGGASRIDRFLRPDFRALYVATRWRSVRWLWLLAGTAYAIIYMLLQGMVAVDPSGDLIPFLAIVNSPVGYGPALVWVPLPTVTVLLRPYTLAAAVALSFFSGLVLSLFGFLVMTGRRKTGALPAPLAGLAVMCPACVTTPATGLFLAYVAPLATAAGLGSAPLFATALATATALLVAGLLLLWLTIAWLSRALAASYDTS
jgi:hypothetical protein